MHVGYSTAIACSGDDAQSPPHAVPVITSSRDVGYSMYLIMRCISIDDLPDFYVDHHLYGIRQHTDTVVFARVLNFKRENMG